MKSRRVVLVSCFGKIRYTTFRAADAVAKRQRRQRDDQPCDPYHCTHCNGFHVGERSKLLRQARAARRASRQAGS